MKVIVLAGGLGTRLSNVPPGHKAAAVLGTRSLLEYALAEVAELGLETVCVVNEDTEPLYRHQVGEFGAILRATSAKTPCEALRGIVTLGEQVLVIHADEVCLESHSALYRVALERCGGPVLGTSSASTDARMELSRRPTTQMSIALGGRLPTLLDSLENERRARSWRRYIGRYAAQVDGYLLAGLQQHASLIEALVHGRPDVVELNVPKRYFDCGTDELMADSRRRIGELA